MRAPAPQIQKGEDARKNWRRINQDSTAIADLIREVNLLRRQVERGSRGSFKIEREPFEVYTTPNTLRSEEDRDADAWRKFKVRAGYIDMEPCTKTDDADATGQTPIEIEVPDATAAYYVWADLTLKEIKHAAALPAYSSTIRPLAKINTATHSARHRALVRQFWLGDIFSGGGGDSFPTWQAA